MADQILAFDVTEQGRAASEPLREDIRLLGGLLGDVIREQEGQEVLDLVEQSRKRAFAVRRQEEDREAFAAIFDGLPTQQALHVIRAFSLFALLANLAEDLHRERRRALHMAAGEPAQDGSLAATFSKLGDAQLSDEQVSDALAGATVVPVITAHPTETRRRTVFQTQSRIKEVMRDRERMSFTTAQEVDALREIIEATGAAEIVERWITQRSQRAIETITSARLGSQISDELVGMTLALSVRKF